MHTHRHKSAAVAAERAVPDGGAYLVRTMDLVRKDVQQHLGVGLGAQVPLVRQLALRLKGGPQLLRVRQVAVVDLRRELREPPRGRLYALTALAAPDRCPEAS